MGRLTVVELRRRGGPDLARDVLRGLSAAPKTLPPVHLYDARGSRLFERITRVPEYYLTRAESSILRRRAEAIVAGGRGPVTLVELGSGRSTKTRTIIEALLARQKRLRYVALDVSRSALVAAAATLLRAYPALTVTACVGDYHAGLAWVQGRRLGPALGLHLGSSIGNLDDRETRRLLRSARAALGTLILGADLRKEADVLEAAYNDAAGVTALFNLNLLRRINAELGGDFDPAAFAHRAFYAAGRGCVEMHLESLRRQEVPVKELGRSFRFARGERIHTEDSRKYTIPELERLASAAGLRRSGLWLDDKGWFSVMRLDRIS